MKNKKMDPDEVKQKIDAMSADLTKLQELVAQFEASNPQLSERDKQEWQLLKDKVQLLAIFHGQKKRLASEDYVKNRTMIRAHAEGVAKRAQKLQETASKLRRDPVS